MTIDGMTAARTGIVQTEGARQDKDLQENRLPFTVNGMLTSVKGLEYIAYVSSGAFPSDSDMTIHCIHSSILKVLKKQGFLPPTLFLQMDNTSKDMKNRHVTNYLAVLVRMGIFKEVLCMSIQSIPIINSFIIIFPLDLLEFSPCRAYSREDRRILLLDFRSIEHLLLLQCEGPTHTDPSSDISYSVSLGSSVRFVVESLGGGNHQVNPRWDEVSWFPFCFCYGW
jgi:hypothetical protein